MDGNVWEEEKKQDQAVVGTKRPENVRYFDAHFLGSRLNRRRSLCRVLDRFDALLSEFDRADEGRHRSFSLGWSCRAPA